MHVVGRKRIFLGSPELFLSISRHPRKEPGSAGLLSRALSADEGRDHPGRRDSAGDLLFIPRGWWHTLIALTPTVMLNHWHGEPLTAAQVRHMYRGMGARYHIAVKTELVQRFVRARSTSARTVSYSPYVDLVHSSNGRRGALV